MKTYITLCFIAILFFATSVFAQSTKKTRRSTTKSNISSSTDFDKFIGMWEFTPDYSLSKGYFKVTKEQPRKFRFIDGFEYEGNITWTETMVNNADGIYLKPLNGKLVGQFSSPNFRATHGYDFTYRITLSLAANGKLLYSVSGDVSEKYYAHRLNNGEGLDEVAPSSNKAVIKSDASRKVLAEKSWQAFWTKFYNAVFEKDFKTLIQLSSSDADFFDGGGGGTSKDWFNLMSTRWNLVKKAIMSGVEPVRAYDWYGEERIERTTKAHIPMIFLFEKDNKWRYSGVMGD